jgi:hypothetical protein
MTLARSFTTHYDGELGSFDYDTSNWKVVQRVDENDFERDVLQYIGIETNGSKIMIPEGVKICRFMFSPDYQKNMSARFSRLETPPVIPEGVTDCSHMFDSQDFLRLTPKLPETLVNANAMFKNCPLLEIPPIIPESVRTCDYMLAGCESLKQPPDIPSTVISVVGILKDTPFAKIKVEDIGFVSQMENYDGPLGKFAYNVNEFELKTIGDEDVLQYIGSETDGNKIEIPEGITSCRLMFAGNTKLKLPVVIPQGVKDCSYMYTGCTSLIRPSKTIKSMRNCNYMYAGCKSLTKAPMPFFRNPKEVLHENILADCEEVVIEAFKANIKKIHYEGNLGTFDYNYKEFTVNSVSTETDVLNYIGKEKEGSKIRIPHGLTDYSNMFRGCEFLERPPLLQKGVTSCAFMFEGCRNLKNAPEIPAGVENCQSMFENCFALKEAPEIPSSVKNCSRMFYKCRSLESTPVIPSSVIDDSLMFEECSEDVQKMGKYNTEHRGKQYKPPKELVFNNDVAKYFQ